MRFINSGLAPPPRTFSFAHLQKLLEEIKITLVSKLNNWRPAGATTHLCVSWRQIFHALSSTPNRNINLIWVKMCVCSSLSLGIWGQLRRNRLSITPAVPIDRLGNQQLSPSDQNRRGEAKAGGEKGGRQPATPLPPNPARFTLVSQGKASLSWGAFGRGLGSLVEVNSSINKHLWTHYRD